MKKIWKKIKKFFLFHFYYKPIINKIIFDKRERITKYERKKWVKIIYGAVELNKEMMEKEAFLNENEKNPFNWVKEKTKKWLNEEKIQEENLSKSKKAGGDKMDNEIKNTSS